MEDDLQSVSDNHSTVEDQLFLAVSSGAVTGGPSAGSMVLIDQIQGHSVRMLVDSGSSHMFISAKLADNLEGVVPNSCPITVRVANGQQLQCLSHIPQASWKVSDLDFNSDIKVLPLSTYDMIVGLDWLSRFSPMKVHWAQKWMIISSLRFLANSLARERATSPANPGRRIGRADGPDRTFPGHFVKKPSNLREINPRSKFLS